MAVLRTFVTPTGPFAFGLVLRYLRSSPSTIVEQVGEVSYARPIRLPSGWGVVRVRRATDAAPGRLAIEVEAPRVRPEDRKAATDFVRRTFQTDVDGRAFARAARRDPVLAAIVNRHPGLRPIQIGNPFETIVWAIIGQQINTTFAAKLKRALLQRYGGALSIGGATYRTFPEPAVVARLSRSDLRPLQFSRQKADYVVGVARAITEDGLDLDALRALPAEQAIERLVQLPGVGRWTAEYLLMRGLGFPDVIPAADGGLRKVMGLAYGFGRNATEGEVRGIAERWQGWRSFGAFYWWFALQQGLVTTSIPTGRTPGTEGSSANYAKKRECRGERPPRFLEELPEVEQETNGKTRLPIAPLAFIRVHSPGTRDAGARTMAPSSPTSPPKCRGGRRSSRSGGC